MIFSRIAIISSKEAPTIVFPVSSDKISHTSSWCSIIYLTSIHGNCYLNLKLLRTHITWAFIAYVTCFLTSLGCKAKTTSSVFHRCKLITLSFLKRFPPWRYMDERISPWFFFSQPCLWEDLSLSFIHSSVSLIPPHFHWLLQRKLQLSKSYNVHMTHLHMSQANR